MTATYILMAVIAYAIGSVNFSVILSKKIAGFDVREKGSGNAGTTNMLRSVGKGAAAITLILDILKGLVSIIIAKYIVGNIVDGINVSILVQLAGFFVVLGHTFPVFFGFKGGKGIATALGVLLLTNPLIGGICLVYALAVMALTKMVSLGSIMAAVLFPILTVFITYNYITDGNYILFGIAMAVLVVFNHRANLKRIYNGTENRLSFKK
ncbi:MAG: glycerol-3-phosphate 1-O-acyltransferase PlsY [Clostridiales bacterium]|nr:glycerol-3-phosphate 1-O-acyltransferase PlsY [Clostridiales bacterium]